MKAVSQNLMATVFTQKINQAGDGIFSCASVCQK